MKQHTTNYCNTLIKVAPDTRKESAEAPPVKGDKLSVANIQYDMISSRPYQLTSDDVIFNTYALRNELTDSELEAARERFFSKGQPCLRTSPLTKTYGWGIHCNGEEKVALVAMESEEYERLANDRSVNQVEAMRSKK